MEDKEKGSAASSTLASTKPLAPGTHSKNIILENQGSSLVTVSFSFTFLSHLCMHLNMLEQGLGLIPGIIYERKVLET